MTQQQYCGSTTRPRRYGRRSMVIKKANIRGHIEAAAAYHKKHPKKKK